MVALRSSASPSSPRLHKSLLYPVEAQYFQWRHEIFLRLELTASVPGLVRDIQCLHSALRIKQVTDQYEFVCFSHFL
jgi:hypothetical protein